MHAQPQGSGPGFRAQRGAAAVFAAIWLVAALAAVGLVVDLGRLYLQQREMQQAANVAALDAARVASGCVVPVSNRFTAAQTEARASLQRNGGELSWFAEEGVRVGQRTTGTDGIRRFVPTAESQSFAVEVSLQRPTPARLIPLFAGEASGTLRARAHAEQLPMTGVHVGTFLGELNNPTLANELLCGLAGGCSVPLNITGPGYQGLVGSNLPLRNLVEGIPDEEIPEFLELPQTVPGLLQQLADALRANGDPAVATTVETIATASNTVQEVAPEQFFDLSEGLESALIDTTVNTWEFTLGALEQAAAGNEVVIALDDALAPLGLPLSLGNNSLTVRVPNGAQVVEGSAGFDETGEPRTFANGSLVQAQFNFELPAILGNTVRLNLITEVAQARAELVDIRCADGSTDSHLVTVDARSGVSRLGVGSYSDISSGTAVEPVTVLELSLLGQPIQIQARALIDVGENEFERLVFDQFGEDNKQRIGVTAEEAVEGALLSLADNLELTVVGLPGGLLGTQIQALLNPILTSLAASLGGVLAGLDPIVIDSLGANLGGADVWVDEPLVNQPVLFTR